MRHRRYAGLGLLVVIGLAGATRANSFDAPAPTAAAAAPDTEAPNTARDGADSTPGQAGSAFGTPDPPSTSTATSTLAVLGTEQLPDDSPPTSAPDATLLPDTITTPSTAPPATAAPTTLTPTMPTSTTPTSTTPHDVERRGEQALARVSYPCRTQLPSWTISFSEGRSGVFGYTYVNERRIEIFVRDDMSDDLLAHVVAHELGHAVDVSLNSGEDRSTWATARGIGGVQWWPGDGVTDFSTGAGDFAEAFAVWQIGPVNYRGRAAGPPSTDHLTLIAGLAAG